eukprot:scaffold24613_cov176-Cylindrotheca_fusiformis.AAC.6
MMDCHVRIDLDICRFPVFGLKALKQTTDISADFTNGHSRTCPLTTTSCSSVARNQPPSSDDNGKISGT